MWGLWRGRAWQQTEGCNPVRVEKSLAKGLKGWKREDGSKLRQCRGRIVLDIPLFIYCFLQWYTSDLVYLCLKCGYCFLTKMPFIFFILLLIMWNIQLFEQKSMIVYDGYVMF